MNSPRSDWLPTLRTGQLAMANEWITVRAAKQTAWNIPQADMTSLASVREIAAAALPHPLCGGGVCPSLRVPAEIRPCEIVKKSLVFINALQAEVL